MNLTVNIGNGIFHNPVCVASGTFGYGSEYENLIDLNKLGAIFTKAVTLEPRTGNEIPRIIETPSGILNSIGLANVGVKRFVQEKISFLEKLPCATVVNVAGSTENEYVEVIKNLESCKSIWGYEINVSCPNVKHGGLAFGTAPFQIERLTKLLRQTTSKPLIIKLTPNVTDITTIAKAAQDGGADAVSCINTLIGMVIDTQKKATALPMKTGGLSGPAIRPVGIALTYKVSRAVSIPVIGIGGIMNADDAIQYFLAGASAIQVGTGNFVDPSIAVNVLEGIIKYSERENIKSISEFHSFIT